MVDGPGLLDADAHAAVMLSLVALAGTQVALLVVGAMLVGAAVVVWWFSARLEQHADASLCWLTVPARVVSCAVREHSSRHWRAWTVEVAYEYEVDGVARSSSRRAVGPMSFPDVVAAERFAQRCRPGQLIEVFVDPADPSRAVLTPGRKSAPSPVVWRVVLLGVFTVGVCLFAAGLVAG